jgi:iron-sulfur cluster assembly protein
MMNDQEVYKIDSMVSGADEDDMLIFTRQALDKISDIRKSNNVPEEYFVRLGSKSGGCKGMSYTITFDAETNDSDREFEAGEEKIVTDAKSLFYLMGVTVDYIEGEHGSGFVFTNPHNANVCGCSH